MIAKLLSASVLSTLFSLPPPCLFLLLLRICIDLFFIAIANDLLLLFDPTTNIEVVEEGVPVPVACMILGCRGISIERST
jgi:hypothetical protein